MVNTGALGGYTCVTQFFWLSAQNDGLHPYLQLIVAVYKCPQSGERLGLSI